MHWNNIVESLKKLSSDMGASYASLSIEKKGEPIVTVSISDPGGFDDED